MYSTVILCSSKFYRLVSYHTWFPVGFEITKQRNVSYRCLPFRSPMLTVAIQIHLYTGVTNLGKPRLKQTTRASMSPKEVSQTVRHRCLWKTSSRPSCWVAVLPVRRQRDADTCAQITVTCRTRLSSSPLTVRVTHNNKPERMNERCSSTQR